MMPWFPVCRTLAGVVACAALAACNSSPACFHSLLSADADGVAMSAPAQAPVRTYLVNVVAVCVPPSVAGRRLVIQTGSGQVDILEMDRQASPVADKIRAALSSGLVLQIHAMDLHGLPYDGRRPVYRVAVDVQWFDAWHGSYALIDAVWTMCIADDRQPLACRSVAQESVSAGIDGVVEGHRCALKALASQMAQALLAHAAVPAEMVRPMPGCLDSATSTVDK